MKAMPQVCMPVFDEHRGEVRTWGTVTLVRYDRYFLMLTAAHVVDALEHRRLYYFTKSGMRPLLCRWRASKLGPDGSRNTDHDDIAVCILPSDDVAAIDAGPFEFLRLEALHDLASDEARTLLIYGFPTRNQTVSKRQAGQQLECQPIWISTRKESMGFEESLGLISGNHFAAKFSPDEVPESEAQITSAHGMSGGIVAVQSETEDFEWVGISHGWHQRKYVTGSLRPLIHSYVMESIRDAARGIQTDRCRALR